MEGYGLEVGGRPPFLGVAMLADTLHIAGKSGEYVYPSDDERYGYFRFTPMLRWAAWIRL